MNRRQIWDANGGQGSNWIWRPTRLKIYKRDGYRCCWCGCRVATGPEIKAASTAAKLATLDHLVSRSAGGSNRPANLVTACLDCNAQRGGKLLEDWLEELDEPSAVVARRLPAA